MSASLVGSEMCIRDRKRPMRVPQSSEFKNYREFKNHYAFTIASCRGAVSYTHLTLPTICSV
eukprot:5688140-Alexandrium_andersonii.AAC.1